MEVKKGLRSALVPCSLSPRSLPLGPSSPLSSSILKTNAQFTPKSGSHVDAKARSLQVHLNHAAPCAAALPAWDGARRRADIVGCRAAVKRLSGSRRASGRAGGRAGRAEARRSCARGSPSGSCGERRGERAGRAQRPAEKGQRRRRLPASARLITRSPLAADLREQINQRARLDEICCYCAHF
jgi:hypothetical protein